LPQGNCVWDAFNAIDPKRIQLSLFCFLRTRNIHLTRESRLPIIEIGFNAVSISEWNRSQYGPSAESSAFSTRKAFARGSLMCPQRQPGKLARLFRKL
jgi:hypothetical protein